MQWEKRKISLAALWQKSEGTILFTSYIISTSNIKPETLNTFYKVNHSSQLSKPPPTQGAKLHMNKREFQFLQILHPQGTYFNSPKPHLLEHFGLFICNLAPCAQVVGL